MKYTETHAFASKRLRVRVRRLCFEIRKASGIERRIEAYRKRRALRNIRATLIAFGIPVEGMTDDELEARTIEVSLKINVCLRKFGVSMGEASEACRLLAEALRSAQENDKL